MEGPTKNNETSKWRSYAQKHIKPWLMNWTDQAVHKWETSQKKAICIIVY